ncbi:hypothetical protein B0H13DRAFT_1877446 [Mycena leptocephala]|nr:hypothetical protein B0H13DRAFT_1877446 [Mycena leptocephala]
MYQGNGSEEEWRQDIANYMTVRHPNIIQMCGTASSGDIHATLFPDGMNTQPRNFKAKDYEGLHYITLQLHYGMGVIFNHNIKPTPSQQNRGFSKFYWLETYIIWFRGFINRRNAHTQA